MAHAASTLGAFMTRSGRLPGFAQRRLDELIAREKTAGLSRTEERELAEALEYIDSKSIVMLRHFSGERAKAS